MITTVAGRGAGYSGDGGPATNALLGRIRGLATDGFGNLYIADGNYHCVRRVDTGGVITTVAGTGERGYSGDGGPATNAQLFHPYDVAVDGSGNLYIADYLNSRVRRVAATGVITTVAGTAERGYSGGRWPGHERAAVFARRRGSGRCREPVHCGQWEQPSTEGRHGGCDHDGGRHGRVGLLRGRRPGDQRAGRIAPRHRGRRIGEPLYRGPLAPPGAQG